MKEPKVLITAQKELIKTSTRDKILPVITPKYIIIKFMGSLIHKEIHQNRETGSFELLQS